MVELQPMPNALHQAIVIAILVVQCRQRLTAPRPDLATITPDPADTRGITAGRPSQSPWVKIPPETDTESGRSKLPSKGSCHKVMRTATAAKTTLREGTGGYDR